MMAQVKFSNGALFTRVSRSFVFDLFPGGRIAMGRRGCSAVAAPSRPTATDRPVSSQPMKGKGKGKEKPAEPPVSGLRGRWRQGVLHEVRQTRNPDAVRVGGANKIMRATSQNEVLWRSRSTHLQVGALGEASAMDPGAEGSVRRNCQSSVEVQRLQQ